MAGETNSFTPAVLASVAKAALGGVSFVVVLVIQLDCPPEVAVVQPTGSAGATTASNCCEKTLVTPPSGRFSVTIPRLVAPSCNWKDAATLPPHGPIGTNVKGRETGVLLVETTP